MARRIWWIGGAVGLVIGLIGGLLVGAVAVGSNAAGEKDPGDGCAVREYAMGLRYQQQSAEIRALQRQSYAVATSNLRETVRKVPKHRRAQLAVMTDIDETVIDNSALLVRDMNACHDYTSWDTWPEWERAGNPTLIAGARAFLKTADRLGVHIFYVSDRYQENKPSTLRTLRAMGLPQVRSAQVLLYSDQSKQVRREQVTKHHRLVMQLGDSLPDFADGFDGANLDRQQQLVRRYAARWGRDWIVLPNATYGAWDDATLQAWRRPFPQPTATPSP